MGCDPEVARYGARWRVAEWVAAWADGAGDAVDPQWLAAARDAFQSGLKAAGVVGTMPNIVANRLNSQLDLAGPSFTVSAEEASGLVALDLAARALRAGELDAAVVGAVDLSHEPVHPRRSRSLGHRRAPGDAAVVLVLKRLADARRDGNAVHAVLAEDEAAATLALGDASGGLDLERSSALPTRPRVCCTSPRPRSRCATARDRGSGRGPRPGSASAASRSSISTLGAPTRAVRLAPGDRVARLGIEAPPRLHVYSGRDRAGVPRRARREARVATPGRPGWCSSRPTATSSAARADAAQRWLRRGGPPPEGVAFRERPVGGELAFVFTGAAAAYPGMGRELALGLPGARRRRRRALREMRQLDGLALRGRRRDARAPARSALGHRRSSASSTPS